MRLLSRNARLARFDDLLERRGFSAYAVIGTGLASGSAFTLIVGGSSVILGTATAAILVRRLRGAAAPA
jgi:hypothetical protein